MPCSDVTEIIQAVVGDDDCLLSYRFVKRTCGQGVGANSLLEDVLVGQSVDEILAIAPEEFLESHPTEEAIEEFLGLKHLIAVQSVLEVLIGQVAGGAEDMCAAAEISYEAGATTIDAVIKVDLVTERIKSCGNCKGCGTSKKKKKPVVFFSDN
jgi:hypothetical protein